MYSLNESSFRMLKIPLFSVYNLKMKRGWNMPFFNYIKIKIKNVSFIKF